MRRYVMYCMICAGHVRYFGVITVNQLETRMTDKVWVSKLTKLLESSACVIQIGMVIWHEIIIFHEIQFVEIVGSIGIQLKRFSRVDSEKIVVIWFTCIRQIHSIKCTDWKCNLKRFELRKIRMYRPSVISICWHFWWFEWKPQAEAI